MSILLETDSGWIISHEKYFNRLEVKSTKSEDSVIGKDRIGAGEGASEEDVQYFKLNPDLFEITQPFKEKTVKGTSNLEFTETTKLVQQLWEMILRHPEAKTIFNNDVPAPVKICDTKKEGGSDNDDNGPCSKKDVANVSSSNGGKWPRTNFKAVAASQRFFETVKDLRWPQCHGHNPDGEMSVISDVRGCIPGTPEGTEEQIHRFIFPPSSKFYCNDVFEMSKIFEIEAGAEEEKFDLIVIDPPWWNKFIRRKKRKQHEAGYEMLNNSGIAALPIKSILKDDGVVVLWCTNARSNKEAVLNEIFPAWNVEFCEMLHWLKVTNLGVPVCPFNVETKKQPYEAIIIGARMNPSLVESNKTEAEPRILISVPSSINSHKPPLMDVIRRLYPRKHFHKKLEVFARYLTPGFTSIGNEVIKLQHISLYDSIS